jgi:zinc transport system ATP-binding protein
MKSLVEVKDLALGYEGKEVFSHLNFQIEERDFIVVLGPNGSGKSTLVKGLLKLLKPMSGEIIYHLSQNRLGYMPQVTKVDAHFPATVFEVVLSGAINRLGKRAFFHREEKALALESLSLLGIEDLKNCAFSELSGGQKQKVLLARALCATRELLILDEPSNNLDLKSKAEFYELIQKLNKEKHIAIILITHDEHGKETLGNKELVFEDDQVIFRRRENHV